MATRSTLELDINVFVCVAGRSVTLDQCIRSFASQSLSENVNLRSLNLVWNMSPDDYAGAVDALSIIPSDPGLSPSINHFFEANRGIPFVRNKALEIAREFGMEWVMFVDDDCIAAPTLLQEMSEIASTRRPTVVAGGWELLPASTPSLWIPRGVFGTKHYRPNGHDVSHGAQLPTAYTRNVLFNLHDVDLLLPQKLIFDETKVTAGGSDVLFFSEITRAGGQIIYAEHAKVVEVYSSDRLQLRWHFQRRIRHTQQKIIRARQTNETFFSTRRLASALFGLLWRTPALLVVLPISLLSVRAKRWVGATVLTSAPFIGALMLLMGVIFNEYDSGSRWHFHRPFLPLPLKSRG